MTADVALAADAEAQPGRTPRERPWYTTKAKPSTSDMAALLRRVIIAARFKASHPAQPTPEEIHAIRLAREDAAA